MDSDKQLVILDDPKVDKKELIIQSDNKELVIQPTDFNKEFSELYKHLNKLNNIKDNIKNTQPCLNMNSEDNMKSIGKFGRKIYEIDPLFRDLLTVMEHPEFYSFYYKYMRDWNKFKKIIVLMKLYDMISHNLYEKDPSEEKHNGYHKLALLNYILKDKELMRIAFKKYNVDQPSMIEN